MRSEERDRASVSGRVEPPLVAFDDLDRAMIQLLQEDGRMSTVTLARRLAVTEPTARRRLKRLLTTGAVHIRAVIHPKAAPAPQASSSIVMLQVELDKLESAGERIAAMPEATSVTITGGEFNLMLVLALDNPAALLEFLTQTIGTLKGIRDWRVISSIKVLKLGQPLVSQGMQGQADLLPLSGTAA